MSKVAGGNDILMVMRGLLRHRLSETVHGLGLARPTIYVSEFPKSGGRWTARMIVDITTSDSMNSGAAPTLVLHQHWRHRENLRPAIYVLRDGRDVVVSLYFHLVRLLLTHSAYFRRRVDRYFTEILGSGYDIDNVRLNLPHFITSLAQRPFAAMLRPGRDKKFLAWPDHVRDWIPRSDVSVLRYEDLLSDTPRELMRISDHLGVELSVRAARRIAASNSFQNLSGRIPGVEDRTSWLRKGVVGDWKDYFTRDAGEAFRSYAGAALVQLGYEPDHGWIAHLPPG